MVSNIWFHWLRIIGVLLFVGIIVQLDWLKVWELIQDIHLDYLGSYLVVLVVAILLKVMRLQLILKRLGYPVSFMNAYRSVIEPAFYGMVTPARLGEFSKIIYLGRFGLTKRLAWGVVLMERMIDFFVLMFASISGLLVFFFDFSSELAAIVFLTLLLLLSLGIRNSIKILVFSERLLHRSPIKVTAINDLIAMKHSGVRLVELGANIILPTTVLVLVLSFWQLWLLASSLGAHISGFYLGLAYSVSSIVSLLPLSIGGLGTREAIYIGLLNQQGVTSNLAVTLSLLDGLILPLIVQFVLFIPLIFARRSVG